MYEIRDSSAMTEKLAIWALGFRPFFLAAFFYSALVMLLWGAIYIFGAHMLVPQLPAVSWHAHEMIFGYCMAVIAGFLLTAVRNWTGIPTLTGGRLLGLFLLWLSARLLPLLPLPGSMAVWAMVDLLFFIFLLLAVAGPIIKAKQWRQAGIMAKLVLLITANACFYAGVFGWYEQGIQVGLYSGLYLIIALILTMLRRLIPFFTERGVGYPVTLPNRAWLDVACLVLFLVFFVADVFVGNRHIAAITAAVLFILHSVRLFGWLTPGIRHYPLLWSLYGGYGFIIAGFALYVAAVYANILPSLSVHAFAIGGIGLITAGMMARVALGHTGRNVHQAPVLLKYTLFALAAAALIRIVLPLFGLEFYRWSVAASQALWVLGFAGLLLIYFPILVKPRVDGQPG